MIDGEKRTWQMIKLINMHAHVIRFYTITIKQKHVKPRKWKINIHVYVYLR